MLSAANWCAATTYYVYNTTQLEDAIDSLAAGDTVVIGYGTYSHSGLTVDVVGTEANPVVIKAATVGAVRWRGYLRIYDSEYVTIDGIVFDQEANPSSTQNVHIENSEHCRMTRCTFDFGETGLVSTDTRYFVVMEGGRYNQIDYCQFNDKITKHPTLKIVHTEYAPTIKYNFFNTHTYAGGANGHETIQLGSGSATGSKGYVMRAKVDYNYFYRCDGEPEIISSKTSENLIRFNTFEECKGQVVLRMADNSEVYNNYFLNPSLKDGVGGIRIHGSYNQIYNNYFYRMTSPTIETRWGDTDTTGGGEETAYRQSKSNLVAFNTMYRCRSSMIDFNDYSSTNPLPPTGWDVMNNIFVSPISTNTFITGSGDVDTLYENNIADEIGSAGVTDIGRTLSSGEMWILFHYLELHADGIYRQRSDSLGRSQATALSELAYNKDLDHESRDSAPDIGADEYRSSSPAYHPLTSSDVGPGAY